FRDRRSRRRLYEFALSDGWHNWFLGVEVSLQQLCAKSSDGTTPYFWASLGTAKTRHGVADRPQFAKLGSNTGSSTPPPRASLHGPLRDAVEVHRQGRRQYQGFGQAQRSVQGRRDEGRRPRRRAVLDARRV